MIKLGGKVIQVNEIGSERSRLFALTSNPNLPQVLKADKAFITKSKNAPKGFPHYITFESLAKEIEFSEGVSFTVLPDEFIYLDDEDIVRITPNKEHIRVLYRKRATNIRL